MRGLFRLFEGGLKSWITYGSYADENNTGFLEFLNLHAGENAPLGQFGYFPGACGEVLTEEKAKKIPGSEKWIGHYVYDGNGLMEGFIEKK